MNIIIIGAGSIGLFFGARMGLSGQPIYAFIANRYYQDIKKEGLILNDLNGKSHKIPNFNPLNQSDKVDLDMNSTICIISVKAIDLEKVCIQYKEILKKVSVIALLQNGLGNEEIITKYYPNTPILRIITSNGAYIPKNGQVTHTGLGPTIIGLSYKITGEPIQLISEFCTILSNAGLNPIYSQDIILKIWWKAFINIGINVFGALTGLRNGELTKIPILKENMILSVKEAYNVAEKIVTNLEPIDNYILQLNEVLNNTALNKNSMLQDILKGSKTEIHYLNGYIVKKGLEYGIPTPLNTLLTALIEGIELNH